MTVRECGAGPRPPWGGVNAVSMRTVMACSLLIAVALHSVSAESNRFPRPADGSGGPTCRRVPTAYRTIQRAIDAAFDGDTVLVDEDGYCESIRFRGKAIIVASRYILDGDTNHIARTVISGTDSGSPDSASVVYCIDGEDTNSVLCGFTITGGRGTMHRYDFPWEGGTVWYRLGGGIYCNGAGPRIVRNIIKGNTCVDSYAMGGGIKVVSLDPATYAIIEENLIAENYVRSSGTNRGWASKGAGASIRVSARICGNRFERNTLVSAGISCLGAGLVFSRMTPGGGGFGPVPSGLIRQNVFRNNQCGVHGTWPSGGGGLIMEDVGETTVESNLVVDNYSADAGGGISVYYCEIGVRLINNIVARNISGLGYGGIALSEGVYSLINNTIAQNSGAGVTVFGSTADVVLVNNIIWGNSGRSLDPQYGAPSLFCRFNDMQGGWPGTGNFSGEPGFVDGMYSLSDSSACIGAGIDTLERGGTVFRTPPTDFDGMARPNPADSRPDLGARENPRALGVNLPFLVVVPQQHDFLNVWPGTWSDTLTVAIRNRGNVPGEIRSIALARSEFRIAHLPKVPVILAAYEQASIQVTFSPTVPGLVVLDTLVLKTSDPRLPETRLALAGRGGSPAACARPGVLYGIADNAAGVAALYMIDKANGSATRLARLSPRPAGPLGAVALHPHDSMMYAAFSSEQVTGIFRLSSEKGDVEPVATIGIGSLSSMAFRGDGTLFFVTSDGLLYSQSSWESVPAVVGVPGHAFTGMAFNPATGMLWATLRDTVFTVDPVSANARTIGWGQGGVSRSTVAFSMLGVLYGLYGTALVRVGTVWGDWQAVGSTDVDDMQAIALRCDVVADDQDPPGPGMSWNLEQNYPNPFNALTVIVYQVGDQGGSGTADVSLTVYDILGQIVAEPVNGRKPVGRYEVQFDGGGLASGYYVYRLTGRLFSLSRRMLLLK